MKRRSPKPAPIPTPGVIAAAEVYTLQEFSRRTGLAERGMRRLRRLGLPVIRVAGRAFIRGSDFLSLLESQVGAIAPGG